MAVNINTVLQQAADQRLWGQIQIDYQDGKVILIRRTETFKPEGTPCDRARTTRY